jgi:hypothetical protein
MYDYMIDDFEHELQFNGINVRTVVDDNGTWIINGDHSNMEIIKNTFYFILGLYDIQYEGVRFTYIDDVTLRIMIE